MADAAHEEEKDQVAEDALTAVYTARDRMRNARVNFRTIVKYEGDKEHEAEFRDFSQRWEPVAEALRSMEALSPRAEVLFGAEIARVFLDLNSKCGLLWHEILEEMQARRDGREPHALDPETGHVLREQRRRVLYAMPERDEYGDQIRALVAKAEAILRPHLIR